VRSSQWIVMTLVVLIGACSPGEDGQPPPPEAAAVQEEATAPEPESDGATPSLETEPAATQDPAAPPSESFASVLGSSQSGFDDVALRLDLLDVRRGETTVSITFAVTNLEDEDDEDAEDWTVANAFSGEASILNDRYGTLAGISIIDTQNARRYPVLFDENEECLCDSGLLGRIVDAGNTSRFTATTGAPPSDVTEVDVQIPGFGTFSAIPLGTG
jgi:hypothetical protein